MTPTQSDQKDVLYKPIIIIGAPRSGTTLMGDILSKHPDVLYVEEPRLTWRYGNDRKSDQFQPSDARPEVVRYIRDTFAKAVKEEGRSRLLEKTPSNSLRLGFIDRVMPDCKIIHMIRDGVSGTLAIHDLWTRHASGMRGLAKGRITQRLKEIQLSRLPYYGMEVIRRSMPKPFKGLVGTNIWGPRLPGMRGMLNELPLMEICAMQWRACVEQACLYGRTMPNDRYCEFRLETFSMEGVKKLLDFCELSPCDPLTEYAESKFNRNVPNRRFDEADPADLEAVRRWTEPTMKWLECDNRDELKAPSE